MARETSVLEVLKFPSRINMWLTVFVSMTVLVNAAIAIEGRYVKQSDFRSFETFTKISFAELHLEMTQERINRIKAVPRSTRKAWQIEELLRLESVKETQLRRLEDHK